MKNRKTYIILYAILVIVLFLPLAQYAFGIFKFRPLWGSATKARKSDFTFSNLASGKYQSDAEKFLSENYGLRQPTIRLYNQFLWTFFKKTYANDVVLGKNGWLYFDKNVKTYYGTYQQTIFKDNAEAKSKYDYNIRVLNKLRHVLKDFDIEFMAYISPDKCYVFPDNIPDRQSDTTTIDAAKYFTESFDRLGFPYIEMSRMYKNIADTLFYTPFSPGGAHWNFSCVYAADTIIHLIEKTGNINLAQIQIGEYRRYNEYEETVKHRCDYDIESMLNLMFRRDHSKYPLYLADITIVSDSTCVKPNVLFVGNSFLWRIKDFIHFDDVFSNPRLWYYNKEAYDLATLAMKPIKKIDKTFEIMLSDYIITFCGDTQLDQISFGFAGETLIKLCLPDSIVEKKIDEICHKQNISRDKAIKIINDNPEVFDELKGDAIPSMRNPQSVDAHRAVSSMKNDKNWMKVLGGHARYLNMSTKDLMELEMKNILDGNTLMRDCDTVVCRQNYQAAVDKLIKYWENDKEKMKYFEKKAKQRGKTMYEMMNLDANYTVLNDKDKYFPRIFNNKQAE